MLSAKAALATLLTALVMTAVPAVAAPETPPLPDSILMNPGKMVTVDGTRRINLSCLGSGSPTVLFDAGSSDSTLSWALVQGEVAKLTRACAYDRAGIGFSDPRKGESDARAAVADIHALLKAAGIKGPVLYVGHSLAGLFGVLLAASYPDDLAGAVLVDPAFAGEWQSMLAASVAAGASPATVDAFIANFKAQVRRYRECAALPAPLPDDCAERDTRLPSSLANFKKVQMSRPSYLLTRASELENAGPTKDGTNVDEKEVEAATANFGDKPLIVLTRGNVDNAIPVFTEEQGAGMYRAWKAGHEKLVPLSTRGSQRVVPGSGHYIQYNKPLAVIEAVKQALTEVRGR
ncbi:MAG TPA: alpha/beta hydrolase [Rhizomicrobium sp.]|nr:alpha/beta hydrolase [Rhizomicrobium sp.]